MCVIVEKCYCDDWQVISFILTSYFLYRMMKMKDGDINEKDPMISIKFKTFGYNNRSVELCFVCLILTYWWLTSEMAPKRFLNFFCPFGNPNLPSQASLLSIFSKGATERCLPSPTRARPVQPRLLCGAFGCPLPLFFMTWLLNFL